ncbi:NUDIX domain-containing protein [Bacillus subtilis]|uniref:NUDIX domain-containing protein n=1 Tax=Bacillus subtilis TaxID=1423 RepID=UPI003F859D14
MVEVMDKKKEIVLAVRSDLLFDEGSRFQGFISKVRGQHLVNNLALAEAITRGDADYDETGDFSGYKQLISYGVVRAEDTGRVFAYKRLEKSGEEKLRGLGSVGIGGHMNPVKDATTIEEVLRLNTYREVQEELNISEPLDDVKMIGFINDDSNDVGKRHIGIVYEVVVSSENTVSVNETENLEGYWLTNDEFKKIDSNTYENWTVLLSKGLV